MLDEGGGTTSQRRLRSRPATPFATNGRRRRTRQAAAEARADSQNGESAAARSPIGSARPICVAPDRPLGERFRVSFLSGVLLRDQNGQRGFDRRPLLLREHAETQFGAQFVDLIDDSHDVRLRLDDVDARRAQEDRVRDRAATGGTGERGSRFCRLLRQNWGNRSSLSRADKPYALMSSRGKTAARRAASECRPRPANQRRRGAHDETHQH